MFLFGTIGLPIIIISIGYSIFYLVSNNLNYEWYYFISPTIDYSIGATIVVMAMLMGKFGNYIYYLHTRLKIRSIRNIQSVKNKRKQLIKIGGTSSFIFFTAFVVLCAGAYFGYKYLETRNVRAHIEIEEAIYALNYASDKIAKFKKINKRWPEQSDNIIGHLYLDNYEYLASIDIIKQLVVVTFKEFNVLPGLRGKSIAYMGYESKSTPPRLLWKCASVDVPLEHLPRNCKTLL